MPSLPDYASTHAAIKAHYLSLPNKTEAGWKEVANNPQKFNRVWRHYLGLPPGDTVPTTAEQEIKNHVDISEQRLPEHRGRR